MRFDPVIGLFASVGGTVFVRWLVSGVGVAGGAGLTRSHVGGRRPRAVPGS